MIKYIPRNIVLWCAVETKFITGEVKCSACPKALTCVPLHRYLQAASK